jgi:serine/threonine-protein kinase
MPGKSVDGLHLLGKLISGRYRIEAFIAHTRTGALYRGEHVLMHKRIAVKVLGREAAERPDELARFEREAIAGAHVDHPNVAAAKDFGELEDGSRFLVVEYLDGSTLRQEIERGPMSLERATRVMRQLALGLEAAHSKGIVHRALSPENVYLLRRGGDDDVVKVVDFGAAKLPPELVTAVPSAAARPERIATPVAHGSTAAYTSPELSMDQAVDGRSDLFALGVILYELLSGNAPAIRRGVPAPPLLASSGHVPAPLDALARKLVAHDRDQRPSSALDVVAVIDALGAAARRMSMPSALEVATGETVLSQPTPSLSRFSDPRGPVSARTAAPASGRARVNGQDPEPSGYDLPHMRGRVPAAPLPRPIWLAIGGATAIVGIVVLAIALRAPFPDEMTGESTTAVPAPMSAAGAPSGSAGIAAAKVTSAAASDAPDKLPAVHDNAEAQEVWKDFARNVGSRRFKDATVGLERLLELDPNAPRDREVRSMIIELAMRIMLVPGDWPTRVYAQITYKMDTVGIDILYELMTTKGGSRAAKLAEELLKDAKIRARGSEALRVTYDLRKAKSCEAKIALFDRAKEHGDTRVLGQLQVLNRDCRRRDTCCLRNDPQLKEAIEALRVRLEGR